MATPKVRVKDRWNDCAVFLVWCLLPMTHSLTYSLTHSFAHWVGTDLPRAQECHHARAVGRQTPRVSLPLPMSDTLVAVESLRTHSLTHSLMCCRIVSQGQAWALWNQFRWFWWYESEVVIVFVRNWRSSCGVLALRWLACAVSFF